MARPGVLEGEVAIVTGSTGGLGAAIARRLAADGAAVLVTGRNCERGDAVVASLTAGRASGRAAFVPADLGDEHAAATLVDAACERWGAVTILVNNAIAATDGASAPVAGVETADWDMALRVNVTAAMWLCRAAIPVMQRTGRGAIVNVSSRAAERAPHALAAYIASKGALNALTRSIAVDYASSGIRCNTVSPGYVLHETRDRDLTPQRRAELEGMHLTRLATADDIAGAVAFLCGPDAACITGVNLPVDGGSSAARGRTLG